MNSDVCAIADKINASDGAEGDHFGGEVSISGNYAIVGAYSNDDNGSAYILHFDGANWVEQQKLIASDGSPNDQFGISVSISGDYAIVGATYDNDNGTYSGSAYIFHFDGSNWVEQQKLLASDGAVEEFFGWAVSINGGYAIVGADEDDDNGAKSGSAYIFHLDGTNWLEHQKLLPFDGGVHEWFGTSVSINGNYSVVGNSNESAYIFHFDGINWLEQQKLLASDSADGDGFGESVSISGNYAIVGALFDDDIGETSGSAYIFHYDGTNWIEQQKLLAPDGDALDYFGGSVSIDGDYGIVGASNDDDNGAFSGSAYIFHYDGSNWVEQQKLLALDGAETDFFGSSVSISGNYSIVGAALDDDNGVDSGSAYIFH